MRLEGRGMRAMWPLWALLLLLALTTLSGCKRLTFVRPNFDKTNYQHTGPD